MSEQKALLLLGKQGQYTIGQRKIEKPGLGELLIKIHAAALNPVDWKIRSYGIIYPDNEYPIVLGTDSAGVVEEVGEGVTNFKKGDKVFHLGAFNNRNATFQQYTIVPAEITAKIPENISFEQAASISQAICTTAVAFYNEAPYGLGLKKPWTEEGLGHYAGKPILINAASTAVGQQAIQLAKLSGFSPIIATSSPSNFGLLKRLGATHTIDRQKISTLTDEMTKITTEKIEYGYDGWSSPESQQAVYDALAPGGKMVIVLGNEIKEVSGKDVTIVSVISNVHGQENRALGVSLYSQLERLLREEKIKPSAIETLPNGLAGIPEGLARLESGRVNGEKLIALPLQTE